METGCLLSVGAVEYEAKLFMPSQCAFGRASVHCQDVCHDINVYVVLIMVLKFVVLRCLDASGYTILCNVHWLGPGVIRFGCSA